MPNRRQRRRRAALVGGAAIAAKKRRDERNAPEQQQQGVPPPPSPAPRAQPAETGGLSAEAIEKLKELGELHEQNVLTDEGFEREKARVLGT